ncbi:cation:proton antiporter [Streptococcus thoraltensis]|uniref:cation:proton antiporter n=1 Tax=Streptococcus thoraltensis TaxID=55085 RepID=UPI001F59D5B3|nr:cation:proton antiporter [Streptococcus thoraltensis]MDY4760667.1 cation:proton antiporter [Streptococcus thoraltensis]
MHALLEIVIILVASLLAGAVSSRLNIPAVVGQLLIGIVIGPPILGLVHNGEILHFLSELGVILLMFMAGLEADFSLLKKYLKPSLLVAITGVVVPLVVFYFLTQAMHFKVSQSVFYGLVFAATSISITVEVLQEYDKVSTDIGAIIIGAAVADDIIAVLLLSFFVSSQGSTENISIQLIEQLLFFVFLWLAIKILIPWLVRRLEVLASKNLMFYVALILCFSLSWLADQVGMSSIIGSFFAGLAIGQTKQGHNVMKRVTSFGYSFFIPIFFASIAFPLRFTGLLEHLSMIISFTILVVLTKLIPGYLVGRGFKFPKMESITIGGGMVSRGEMALIIIGVGQAAHIIGNRVYSELVIITIASTVIAPFILKYSFKGSKGPQKGLNSTDGY